MTSTEIGIALGAGSLGVALFAAGWTVYRDIVTRGELRRETEERKDQLAREEGRRDDELRYLKIQVDRQLASEIDSKRADLIGKSTGWAGDGQGVTFPMSVRNAGPAVARDIEVWLAVVTDDPSTAAAPKLTTTQELGDLAATDPAATFSLQQPGIKVGLATQRAGLIVASWNDGTGPRLETIGKLTVFV